MNQDTTLHFAIFGNIKYIIYMFFFFCMFSDINSFTVLIYYTCCDIIGCIGFFFNRLSCQSLKYF